MNLLEKTDCVITLFRCKINLENKILTFFLTHMFFQMNLQIFTQNIMSSTTIKTAKTCGSSSLKLEVKEEEL